MSPEELSQERKLTGDTVSISLQLDRQIQSRNHDEVREASLRNQLARYGQPMKNFGSACLLIILG
jgi:hypothetical protein